MSKGARREARQYFVPVLLGSNKLSRRLSAKIFKKYGIISLVLDRKISFLEYLNPFSCAYKLEASEADLICEEISRVAKQQSYTLPLLIATNEKYRALAKDYAPSLEPLFVICEANELFERSPLCDIENL